MNNCHELLEPTIEEEDKSVPYTELIVVKFQLGTVKTL